MVPNVCSAHQEGGLLQCSRRSHSDKRHSLGHGRAHKRRCLYSSVCEGLRDSHCLQLSLGTLAWRTSTATRRGGSGRNGHLGCLEGLLHSFAWKSNYTAFFQGVSWHLYIFPETKTLNFPIFKSEIKFWFQMEWRSHVLWINNTHPRFLVDGALAINTRGQSNADGGQRPVCTRGDVKFTYSRR